MRLDPEICERARQARDPRFDGRFFIGVRTTGVYCRPVCGVRPPLEKNVTYYASAAGAEEGGFRPCKRCRPESAPGTPAWLGSSATVARALRMIENGALDGAGSVEALASRLGVGARHLRRLFIEHVGAPPLSVARTRRAHFARRLIDGTSLPMAEIAQASGFGSIRQFNDAIRSTFRQSPRELRKASGGEDAGVVLRLPYRAPFDGKGLLEFMAPRAIEGVEIVGERSYARVAGPRTALSVTLPEGDEPLEVRILGDVPADLIRVAERVRGLFDLAADPEHIARDLHRDPVLRKLVRRRPGLRVPGAFDPFEIGVRAILGQQVSVVGATTLAGRLVATFGKPLETTLVEGLTHEFPSAARLAEADVQTIGLPGARAEAIRGFAAACAADEIPFDGAAPLEELLEALKALRGFGDWTAQYVAMRALGEPDAFPAGDLGLRKALGTPGSLATEREAREAAEAWRPWRSYAALWLWSSLGDDPSAKKPRAQRKSR